MTVRVTGKATGRSTGGEVFAGRVVVLTGAGNGIGRAMALQLARRGARLVLWDADPAALAEVTQDCRAFGAVVRADIVDVRDPDQVTAAVTATGTAAAAEAAWAATGAAAGAATDEIDGAGGDSGEVGEDDGGVGAVDGGGEAGEVGAPEIVVCLAGVIHTGRFLDSAPEDYARVMDVNYWGTVNTVRAWLPAMLASDRGGQVVTVSSAFGLLAVGRYGAYSASKFAVRGFTEALAQELAMDGHPVRVSCVYPGGVRTGIVRNGRFAPGEDPDTVTARFDRSVARTSPEAAAAAILRGIERGRSRILVGRDARAVAVAARVLAGSYPRILGRIFRREVTSGKNGPLNR